MPITNQQLSQVVRHTKLDFFQEDGTPAGDLNLWFLPNAISQAELRRLKEETPADDDAGFAPMLARTIVRWDYRHSIDGPDLPVTEATMAEIGYAIQKDIARALAETVAVNPPTAPSSGAPSVASPTPISPTAPSPSSFAATGGSATPAY